MEPDQPHILFSLGGHTAPVLALDIDHQHNPTRLLSGSEDGSARLWDLEARKVARGIRAVPSDPAAAPRPVTAVKFSPLSPEHTVYIAAGNQMLVFDLRAPGMVLSTPSSSFPPAKEEINSIAISDKEQYVATVDDSGDVLVMDTSFDGNRGRCRRMRRGHDNIAMAVAFRPTKTWEVWSGGMDSTMKQWDFSRGTTINEYDMTVAEAAPTPQVVNPPHIHSLAVASDGRALASGLGDGSIFVLAQPAPAIDTKSKGKDKGDKKKRAPMISSRLEGHNWSVSAVDFITNSPTATATASQLLVSGGIDGQLKLWGPSGIEEQSPYVVRTAYQLDKRVNAMKCAWMPTRTGGDVAHDSIVAFVSGVSRSDNPASARASTEIEAVMVEQLART
ncbi:WD40-repeat-containing domain protein [Polychytrium aggregatum]|uniref:WD40-repeat-containing domain protein n=1 Tax=Polychytrium aggregatum TaxID=110093 RepID=UPI0022FE677A|nr:WD40-repeat-containing domain protein [Polychytrium aggregatum]KAI9208626.1 WD40-repeat-containing domain protein [Polychytrium aggregatum]